MESEMSAREGFSPELPSADAGPDSPRSLHAMREILAARPRFYQDMLVRMARKHTGNTALIEDVAQETFLKAWALVANFEEATVYSYLAVMVRNEFLQRIRGRHFGAGRTAESHFLPRVSADDSDELQRMTVQPAQEWAVALAETLEAIAQLPEHQQRAIYLATIHGEVKAAALSVGMKPNTMFGHVKAARQSLRGAPVREAA
jgi:RNA polymerase sigma factor (sigma-70 family)